MGEPAAIILLRGQNIKLSSTYLYTHRGMHHSALLREASFGN